MTTSSLQISIIISILFFSTQEYFMNQQVSSLKVPLALAFLGCPSKLTTSPDSATTYSTKLSGTIPLYRFMQNLMEQQRAKPAMAKGSNTHTMIVLAEWLLSGCTTGECELLISMTLQTSLSDFGQCGVQMEGSRVSFTVASAPAKKMS